MPRFFRREIPSGVDTGFSTPYGPLGAADTTSQQAIANAENAFDANPPSGWAPAQAAASWQALAKSLATDYCAARGYNRAVRVSSGSEHWSYSTDQDSGSDYQFQASKYRRWTATCQKTKRVRR